MLFVNVCKKYNEFREALVARTRPTPGTTRRAR